MVFMPAAHPIALTAEEDRTLYELSLANGIARRIKLRATALRLKASGWPNICISVSIRCDRRSNAANKVTRRTVEGSGLWGQEEMAKCRY